MNEPLRRALLRARLSEEDVAARLEVDPKTVRRWLEGRVPYPRHRWLLAATLRLDEADLWPQLAASRPWPQEIQAIYPHRDDIPSETWLRLFSHARKRIDILASSALFLAADPEAMAMLANRAAAGVKERICLRAPQARDHSGANTSAEVAARAKGALVHYEKLRQHGDVELRTYRVEPSSYMYRSDEECLVNPRVHGFMSSRTPILRLHEIIGEEIFESYLKSFESVWVQSDSF